MRSTLSRRDVLKAGTVLAAGAVFPEPLKAAAPEPSAVTPALIQAARKEGEVAFYTAMDIPVAEQLGKTFEAKYPGIAVPAAPFGPFAGRLLIGSSSQLQGYEINLTRMIADGVTIPVIASGGAGKPEHQHGRDRDGSKQ